MRIQMLLVALTCVSLAVSLPIDAPTEFEAYMASVILSSIPLVDLTNDNQTVERDSRKRVAIDLTEQALTEFSKVLDLESDEKVLRTKVIHRIAKRPNYNDLTVRELRKQIELEFKAAAPIYQAKTSKSQHKFKTLTSKQAKQRRELDSMSKTNQARQIELQAQIEIQRLALHRIKQNDAINARRFDELHAIYQKMDDDREKDLAMTSRDHKTCRFDVPVQKRPFEEKVMIVSSRITRKPVHKSFEGARSLIALQQKSATEKAA